MADNGRRPSCAAAGHAGQQNRGHRHHAHVDVAPALCADSLQTGGVPVALRSGPRRRGERKLPP